MDALLAPPDRDYQFAVSSRPVHGDHCNGQPLAQSGRTDAHQCGLKRRPSHLDSRLIRVHVRTEFKCVSAFVRVWDTCMGTDKLSHRGQSGQGACDLSCSRRGRSPIAISVGSEEAKRRPADQVSLDVEGVVDGGVGGEEPLC